MRSSHSLYPTPSLARAGAHLLGAEQCTLIRGRVEYALSLTDLTAPIHTLFVRSMIERILAYRRGDIARVRG